MFPEYNFVITSIRNKANEDVVYQGNLTEEQYTKIEVLLDSLLED